VRKSQRGQIAILTRESGKAVDHNSELLEDESESGADENEVCVATTEKSERRAAALRRSCALCNITRCRAETLIVSESDGWREIDNTRKTHWMMPAADGATVPKVCTCAITS